MVAKGYSQKFGIDYVKTFTPTAKINIVRILLALGVHFNWTLQQVDVKNAFLRGDLEELMYMEPPREFNESFGDNKVCKLEKALYC